MRIGAPTMLCVEPLLPGVAGEAGVVVERATPRGLVDRLRLGTLDAALVPSTDAARLEHGRAIPGLGLVFSSASLTELLMARVDLTCVERLSVNEESGGGNDWARVILAEWFDARPASAPVSDTDARVISGWFVEEPAPTFPVRYDLGALWHEHTGMPFVAMLWVARFGAHLAELRRTLSMAAQRGAAMAVPPTPSASYRVGGEAMDGLRLYIEMAVHHGLLEKGSEVRFC